MAYRSGSVNVLYCFDGNTVRYCFKLGSFYVKWFVYEGDHVNAVRYFL